MRKTVLGMTVIALGVAIVVSGCGKRQNPVADPVIGDQGTIWTAALDFGPTGSGQLPAAGTGLTLSESPLRVSKAYRPPGYRERGQGRPYPVLYLLLDFGGNGLPSALVDEDYYFEVGLRQIADSMINAGVILPMVVATVDLYNAYGGSWYTSNGVQGSYEDALLEFVQYVDTGLNVYREEGRLSRAIGGVGMGGYGAMMMAMKHPDLFSSASSINGHLAFASPDAGHNFNGVLDWAPRVFAENFVTPLPPFTITDPDSVVAFANENRDAVRPYYNMTPNISEPLRKPYTNLMFSMAAAFSPFGGTSVDSATWMGPLWVDALNPLQNWKVTLPFTFTGELWAPSFGKWRMNDATQYLLSNSSALINTALHIEAGTTAEFNILAQNRIFMDAVVARNVNAEYVEFEGYDGYPTQSRHYLADRLRKILKFHSDNLAGASTLGP
jgi:S-formylglutathione hydrolase FrmB